jgi:hypothetical protein
MHDIDTIYVQVSIMRMAHLGEVIGKSLTQPALATPVKMLPPITSVIL